MTAFAATCWPRLANFTVALAPGRKRAMSAFGITFRATMLANSADVRSPSDRGSGPDQTDNSCQNRAAHGCGAVALTAWAVVAAVRRGTGSSPSCSPPGTPSRTRSSCSPSRSRSASDPRPRLRGGLNRDEVADGLHFANSRLPARRCRAAAIRIAAANTPAIAEPDESGLPFSATWFLYSGLSRSATSSAGS